MASSSAILVRKEDEVVINVKDTVTKQVPPDGGFGWVVSGATFAITFLLTGFFKSASAFGPRVADEFPGTDSSESGWIFGLIGALSLLVSPASAMFAAEFGSHVAIVSGGVLCSTGLFLSYFATSAGILIGTVGVFLGLGSSMVITIATSLVGKYFTDKKPYAITLALSGGCLGAFAVPIGVEAVLSALGMRCTFLVCGAFLLVVPVLGLMFGPPEARFVTVTEEVDASTAEVESEPKEPTGNPVYRFVATVFDKLGFSFFKDVEFLLLAACIFGIQLGNPTFRGFVADQGKTFGSTAQYATYLAVGDLLARILYGLFNSRSRLPRDMELCLFALTSGVFVAVLPLCAATWTLALLSSGAACLTSVIVICIPLALSANHGAENLAKTLGIARMLQGIANFVSRPLTGALKSSHGFSVGIGFSGACLIAASVLAIALCMVRKNRQGAQPKP